MADKTFAEYLRKYKEVWLTYIYLPRKKQWVLHMKLVYEWGKNVTQEVHGQLSGTVADDGRKVPNAQDLALCITVLEKQLCP